MLDTSSLDLVEIQKISFRRRVTYYGNSKTFLKYDTYSFSNKKQQWFQKEWITDCKHWATITSVQVFDKDMQKLKSSNDEYGVNMVDQYTQRGFGSDLIRAYFLGYKKAWNMVCEK
jgi:hypothetical protein